MVSFTMDPDLIDEFDAWLAAHELPPAKNAVIEAALRAFLRDNPPRLAGAGGVGGD